MTIVAECLDCGRTYRLEERFAGRRIRCKDCGEVVEVPDKTRRGGGPRRAASGRSGGRRSARRDSSKAADKRTLIIVGSVFGGIAAVIALVFLTRGGEKDNSAAPDQATSVPSDAAATVAAAVQESPAEKALREQQYEARLSQQRAERSARERDSMARSVGAHRVATVVFSNVVGDTDAAHKYLNRKVFRAAYADYQAGQQRAQQQTEQNRKAAEAQAVEQHKNMWGGYGPGFVQYRYKRVRSDMPYPRIIRGPQMGSSYTYHVSPVSDLNAFARRVGVGNVSSVAGRTVNIAATLPTPIPDPDVEELELEYGREKVAHVTVTGATGEIDRVQLFIRNQIESLQSDGGPKVSVVALKAEGDGRFRFSAGPIADLDLFAERLSWASLGTSDSASRELTLAANLPGDLPSKAELDAERKEKQAKEKAIRDADWAHRPRPDESELDWALREIKENDSGGMKKALVALSLMEVVPERHQEVSDILCRTLRENSWHVKEHLEAMLQWRTDRTERAILTLGGSFSSRTRNAEPLMQAFVKLGTETSARALASALPDFFSGDKCVPYLIEIGPVAEPQVLAFIKHKDDKVRQRVYNILAEIGTTASVSALKSNIRLEKGGMQIMAEDCLKAIRTRLSAETEKEADTTEQPAGDSKKDGGTI